MAGALAVHNRAISTKATVYVIPLDEIAFRKHFTTARALEKASLQMLGKMVTPVGTVFLGAVNLGQSVSCS